MGLNYVGVDVHKNSFQAAIVDERGGLLEEFRLRNNREGILRLVGRAERYGGFRAVVESSANYWTKLFDVLEENGVPVKLSNPYRTKAIAEAKVKTDKVDARTLAQLLRADLVAESYVSSRDDRDRRALIRDKQNQIRLLLGLKGIDYYSAMILLSEIGDSRRFSSPEKLVSWAGLAPRTIQSGETCYNTHITKKGSRRVRQILGQAAQTARQHDPKFRAFYERVAARKGHGKALVATMRKMMVVIWTILTKNEPYSGQDEDLMEKKYNRMMRLSSR